MGGIRWEAGPERVGGGGWRLDDDDEEQENARSSDKRDRVRKRGEKARERESERVGGVGGECEKPGCSVSAPGSAACYFSCAGALASSPCSHAIVTPSVWWHGT